MFYTENRHENSYCALYSTVFLDLVLFQKAQYGEGKVFAKVNKSQRWYSVRTRKGLI